MRQSKLWCAIGVIAWGVFATGAAIVFANAPAASPEKRASAQATPQTAERRPDVIFVPTPPAVASAMLKLAGVTQDDVVYDLGCGDGAIVVAAARDFGAHVVGIDIDPKRIEEATRNVANAGVSNLVTLRQEDLFESDISEATVVTLYLLPSLNVKLMPKLKSELRPGTRIVSHAFDMMGEWPPERQEEVDGRYIYFWTVPPRE